jgi:outer membrane receptor protein involved in Fe transport
MTRSRYITNITGVLGFCLVASAAGVSAAQQPAASDDAGEVVVTGSRVITNGNNSPTPLTVVRMEQLQEANPGPVAQAIAQLPALLASPNQGGQGPGAQAVINLRGINGGRNLTLLDGHRQPQTGASGVDTNLIPSMLLKRVDIVTGGASAVYGSDAVTGVVNFIMDDNFNGLKFTTQYGISAYNDDPSINAGIAGGTELFGGRGHIEASYQHFNDHGVHDRFDRAWGRGLYSMQGAVPNSTATAGTTANPWLLYSNSRFSTTNFGGVINTGPLANLWFSQNGLLGPYDRGQPTGSGGAQIGGDGGYFTTTSAFGGQRMDQAFGRFDYDFSNTVRGYVEIAATTVLNSSNNTNTQLAARAIGYNNAYLATIQPQYRALLPAALQSGAGAIGTINAAGSFNFSKIFNELDAFPAPRGENRGTSRTYIAGLSGDLGDYKWEIGYEHATEKTDNANPNNISNPRLFAALNAVVNPANGQIVCNAALVNPTVYGSCVPLNVFGPSSMTRAAFDYIRNPSVTTTNNVMDDISGSITGSPFSLWAGPVDLALSGEWRRQTYGVNSTAHPTDPFSCVGIQFNCTATLAPYANSTADFPTAEVTVGEGAFEAQIPLLKDFVLAKNLDANLAARYTNYSTSGAEWSWKAGATWDIDDNLSFRMTRSRDIRAPTLANLFAPLTIGTSVPLADSHVFGLDPATGLPYDNNATPSTINQGNPKLLPELGDTWTAGYVFTPTFLPGFSVSMDYYNIDITQGIFGPSPFAPATQRACEDSEGASPVCLLYVRPLPFSNHTSANKVITINNFLVNTGGVSAEGVDTEVDYSHPINGHNFSARILVNYQPNLTYDLAPAPSVNVAGAADGVNVLPATPNVKGLMQINYEVMRGLSTTVQFRYRNAMRQNGNDSLIFVKNLGVDPAWWADFNVSYKVATGPGDLNIFFNVRNVFNTPPEPWASTGGTAQIGTFGGWLQGDDPLGRYFKLGLSYKM